MPALRHGAHYPLAQEAPGTAVGSWQSPHAPAGTNELTGNFLALISMMESHFLCSFPSAMHMGSSTTLWPVAGRAAELSSSLGGTSAPSGSCQLLFTP